MNRRHRQAFAAAVVLAGVSAASAASAGSAHTRPSSAAAAVRTAAVPAADIQSLMLRGQGVLLDSTVYVPARTPAPAVLLAHGFGGSKGDLDAQARSLQADGFIVLAWTARGFGASTGNIEMDSPNAEAADVSRLIDYLASRSDVQMDSARDPRVGIAGSSYGGGIALISAALDHRIDAVAANITWNDLQQALFPQSAAQAGTAGVLKKAWVGDLISLTRPAFPVGAGSNSSRQLVCGRLDPAWCREYQSSVATGTPTPMLTKLLAASSPATWADRITAPTLLMQGEADSLFGLDESLRTAREIRAAHPSTPLALVWHAGGHDAAASEVARQRSLMQEWLEKHLAAKAITFPNFQVTQSAGSISLTDSAPAPKVFESADLPLAATLTTHALDRSTRIFASPIGGQPAAVTSLPGIGSTNLTGSAGTMLLAGQSAVWAGPALTSPVSITGAPTVKVRVTSSTGRATLFFSTLIKSASGGYTQPAGLVAPVKLVGIPRAGTVVTVQLPSVVATAAPGDSLAVAVSATDQSFDVPNSAQVYSVTPVSDLSVPSLDVQPLASAGSIWLWPGITLAVVLAGGMCAWLFRRRKPTTAPFEMAIEVSEGRGDLPQEAGGLHEGGGRAEVPLVAVRHLVKTYADDFTAVNNLSFDVHRGQVLGLLGPNGAGKTTTLRMLMGLILPTGGEIDIDGEAVYPGSPALARLGSFVEGPGFMPHLSGAANLDLYWRSTGRSEDPQLERALTIAGLGDALNKKVKSYSHGMKQRLAIAQAMLGMPDLLVLDEPTNGLDPAQIRAMRAVLRDYAATGRTIIVSSHLLAEVQQTCSHVVVMHRGHLVAAGAIDDILHKGSGSNPQLEDVFMALIGSDTINGQGAGA